MIGRVSKRKKMDNFENFNKKFKEMKVEGKRKSVTGVIYTEYEPYFLSKQLYCI